MAQQHPLGGTNLEAHPDVEVKMAGDRFRA
jgi:hypothetical protein